MSLSQWVFVKHQKFVLFKESGKTWERVPPCQKDLKYAIYNKICIEEEN